MAKLKVFGGALIKRGVQSRFIVAATSVKKAADVAGCSISEIRNYWSESGNQKEIAIATAKPETLFVKIGKIYHDGEYVEYSGML